ncbi:MAG: C40 family peptidase [Bacteroidetes bacterium]|nr:C40 family peptidase [Bacteroidota bacterium]
MLSVLVFVALTDDLIAAKKPAKKKKNTRKKVRVYNPPQTKANAIMRLQTSSELSELAKIEPNTSTNTESKAYQKEAVTIASNINETQMLSDVELLKTFLSDEEMMDTENGDEGEDLTELEAEDDIKVNLDDFRSIWLIAIGGGGDNSKTSFGTEKELMMDLIMDWIGTPYRFGGMSQKAIDCSAWTRAIFFQSDSIVLPRTAREQINVGKNVNKNNLEFGDLVFFHTYSRKFASHVGIYLGDNLFAHASSAEGVTISSLNSTFYNSRFIGGRRLSEIDLYAYRTQRGSITNIIEK